MCFLRSTMSNEAQRKALGKGNAAWVAATNRQTFVASNTVKREDAKKQTMQQFKRLLQMERQIDRSQTQPLTVNR